LRVFIAVFPPNEVVDGLAALVERVRRPGDGISWVKPANLHYTLRFLGELEERRAEAACRAAAQAVIGLAPFAAALGAPGAFPDFRRPRVLWIGLDAGREPLELLARSLDEALRREGFGPPDKPFRAHLTLGRVREPGGGGGGVAGGLSGERAPGRFTVAALTVVHSTLDPRGSVYRPLGQYPLRGA
jgi:RNA 2',3'-cyclic 3'-phosphodiesterase